MPSLILLLPSMMQVAREKADLNPPRKDRLYDACVPNSSKLRRRNPDPHCSTPSVGSGSFSRKPDAFGRILLIPPVTAVIRDGSGLASQESTSGNTSTMIPDKAKALDCISVPVELNIAVICGCLPQLRPLFSHHKAPPTHPTHTPCSTLRDASLTTSGTSSFMGSSKYLARRELEEEWRPGNERTFLELESEEEGSSEKSAVNRHKPATGIYN